MGCDFNSREFNGSGSSLCVSSLTSLFYSSLFLIHSPLPLFFLGCFKFCPRPGPARLATSGSLFFSVFFSVFRFFFLCLLFLWLTAFDFCVAWRLFFPHIHPSFFLSQFDRRLRVHQSILCMKLVLKSGSGVSERQVQSEWSSCCISTLLFLYQKRNFSSNKHQETHSCTSLFKSLSRFLFRKKNKRRRRRKDQNFSRKHFSSYLFFSFVGTKLKDSKRTPFKI